VTPQAADAPPAAFRAEERPDGLVLSTDALSVEIDWRTAAFTYRDPAGAILTREPARGGKTLDPIDALVSLRLPMVRAQPRWRRRASVPTNFGTLLGPWKCSCDGSSHWCDRAQNAVDDR
jgi:hypothetical protein